MKSRMNVTCEGMPRFSPTWPACIGCGTVVEARNFLGKSRSVVRDRRSIYSVAHFTERSNADTNCGMQVSIHQANTSTLSVQDCTAVCAHHVEVFRS